MKIALIVAILPAAILLYYIYSKDRLEKEPAKLLVKLLIFGALCAIPASVFEQIGLNLLEYDGGSIRYAALECFCVIALAEEGCKYLAMKWTTWKNPEFNCSFDGIVYAVFTSLGFAILENILYVFEYGIGNGLVRAVTSIPGHCFFGVFMGAFYARAKEADYNGHPGRAKSLRLRGLLVALLVHGTYDFLLTVSGTTCTVLFIIGLLVMYFFGFRTVKRSSTKDRYLVAPPVFDGFRPMDEGSPFDRQ